MQQCSTGDLISSAKSSYVQQTKSFDTGDDRNERSKPLEEAQEGFRLQGKGKEQPEFGAGV